MAHEIEATDRVGYALKPAWHKLGKVYDHPLTPAEVRTLVNILVHSEDVFDKDGAAIPGFRGIWRDDSRNCLAIHGDDYQIVQFGEVFDSLLTVLGERDLVFESAGTLRGGKIAWVLARKPTDLLIGGVDPVAQYIAAVTSHDGSYPIEFWPTDIRIECANLLRAAYYGNAKQEYRVRVKHTLNVAQTLREATTAWARSNSMLDVLKDTSEKLFQIKLERPKFFEITEMLLESAYGKVEKVQASLLDNVITNTEAKQSIRERRRAEALDKIVESYDDMRNRSIFGTAWGGYNAFSELMDHGRRYRGDETKRAESQMLSNFVGASDEMKQEAVQAYLSLAS